MFAYMALMILYLPLIAWDVLILYRIVRLIAGPPALGLTLAISVILAAAVAIWPWGHVTVSDAGEFRGDPL